MYRYCARTDWFDKMVGTTFQGYQAIWLIHKNNGRQKAFRVDPNDDLAHATTGFQNEHESLSVHLSVVLAPCVFAVRAQYNGADLTSVDVQAHAIVAAAMVSVHRGTPCSGISNVLEPSGDA